MPTKKIRVNSEEVGSMPQNEVDLVNCDSQIEILRLVSLNQLSVSIVEQEFEADWDGVEWQHMRLIGDSLVDLICEVNKIPRDQVKTMTRYSDLTAGKSIAIISYRGPAAVVAGMGQP